MAKALRRLGFVPAPRGVRRTWLDLAFVLWLWVGFDAMNNLAPVRQAAAERHARDVLALEQTLHLAPEHALNVWLAVHHSVRDLVVFWYYNVHGVVTIGLFVWLWWRRPLLVARNRLALILLNLAALAVFWSWPVAPPRMLVSDGYRDLVSLTLGGPTWHAGATAIDSNQLTALPSLHIAWAVWSVVVLWQVCHRRRARALLVCYPFVTLFAVMATANHFLADGVAGALMMALAFLAADRIRASARVRRATPHAPPAPVLAPEGAGDA